MDELEPGRLAVWRVEGAGDALRLHIDLDYDQAVTLTISADGHATTTLSDRFTTWLTTAAAADTGPCR